MVLHRTVLANSALLSSGLLCHSTNQLLRMWLATATIAFAIAARTVQAQATSPLPAGYPSPWASGGPGWDEAYVKAKEFVSKLTLVEKVNITS